MSADDILPAITLVVCVVAVFMARRGARRKLASTYAQGARDVSARASAHVVVGDVVNYNGVGVGDVSGAGIEAARPVRGSVTMRRPGPDALGVGGVCDLAGVSTVGELPGSGDVALGAAARRTARFSRVARFAELTETTEQ